ncbi:WxL domain-containing protein [Enterococcus gilvus]|uniref:WxL domain-containing protein n=1 Tax=Enterococcus gilvus TaxID=160453 RepID=UPI003D6BA2CF
MKKELLRGLLATSMIGGIALGLAAPASADSLDTDTTIGFKTDSHIEPPVDPADGTLALLWAPKKFDFGQNHVAGSSGPAIAQKSDVELAGKKAYVVVRDDRAVDPANEWKLTVQGSNLATTGPKYLTGASYTLNAKNALKYVGSSSPELAGSTGGADASVTTTTQTFAAGGSAVEIAKMAAPSAKDAWAIEVSDIELTVPVGDVALAADGEKYNGKLTWTLSDTI